MVIVALMWLDSAFIAGKNVVEITGAFSRNDAEVGE